jgi:2-succinyl-6-hydroxy-2,4-cyclohexadiene-1-carboxylate synthase
MADAGAGRLVFLHGFTQTHHHWHPCAHLILRRLSARPPLVFLDLPGHGLSDTDRTSIDDAGEVAAAAGPGTYIGYSMGARWAIAAASAGSPEIERLVLIGGTAGIEEPDRRRQRVESDELLAARAHAVGVETFIDEWLASPMFTALPPDPTGRRQRLRNTADGLASSLRLAGAGAQPPVWDVLASVTVPALVLAGANDHKFTTIGERLADAMPNATLAVVPDAGHAAHIEQPDATARLIAEWLE